MEQPPLTIEYLFELQDKSVERFTVRLDPLTLEMLPETSDKLPGWTALSFCQCAGCPLPAATPDCPAAANLAPIVKRFDRLLSFDKVLLEVTTEERLCRQATTAQKAICSLLGLVIATSACPCTAFFKPMARFHLPLASEEETIFRATATYMLSQYFVNNSGETADFNLSGLQKIYLKIQEVNMGMAKRLRHAAKTDSSINAIVLLDMYAKALPYVIKQSLEELRYLFEPFLKRSSGTIPPSC
ncbi:DUF6901 family protein [Thiovibrio sp. JS02]